MAGIFQPNSSDICTEISLVQGFCCFVSFKINNTDSYSCLHVKKLNNKKEMDSNEIRDFELTAAPGEDIVEVKYESFKLKYYWILNFFKFLFLFY